VQSLGGSRTIICVSLRDPCKLSAYGIHRELSFFPLAFEAQTLVSYS
jgi:hypothetical protein